MIVGGHSSIFELAGRFIRELSQCDTNFHAELFHVPHNIENRLELGLALANPLPSSPHAESPSACGFGLTRFRKNRIPLHEWLGFYPCCVTRTLGAVTAVLTTTTRFDAQQAT